MLEALNPIVKKLVGDGRIASDMIMILASVYKDTGNI